ncbi:HU family DNA-binding protein [Bacteroides sp. GM023]|uniref:HU family DNA-binding protein n=1 Tax=Bacteroides sp. GM023 TaxID=2723058 RepID=UPI00168BD21E|nr:HU family DNA-binding protein [Bacteroides sp. GM023]MBD3589649.1 HU family DNA-binding protein [Bacteroides sp. GM023]
MNERLTIQDLTDLLAAKHSMTKKDAEAFVKEFFLLIEQALESENTVKIKGLGTFKLIDVDSRESVNVNTGERFQIKGHTKVSFSPDASLRDIINKPFAHFETVVLNENTILEDTPVEETEEEEIGEEIPAKTPASEKEEVQEGDYSSTVVEINEAVDESENLSEEEAVQEEQVTEQSEETTIEEQITDEIAPLVVEEPIEQPKEEEVVKETSIIEQQPTPIKEKEGFTAEEIIEKELLKANLKPEIPIIPAKEENANPVKPAQTTVSPSSKKKTPAKEKSPVPYLVAVIILVLLLCGGVVLFIYYPDLFSSSSDKNALDMPPVTTQPVQPETQLSDTIEHKDTIKEITPDIPKAVVTPQPVAKKEEVITPTKTENKVVQQQPSASAYLDSASYKITGTKTKYTIKEGETLTRVSLQFYGTKAMWPYIVKHNPDVIKNPNNVPYGTTIKIPELIKE